MPEVTQSVRDPDSSELPASARALLKKAAALDWETHTLRTVVHHEETYMVSDPTKLKKAAHDAVHTWLAAKSPSYVLGFIAAWEGSSFKGAKVLDPIGMPVELYYDYKPVTTTRDPKEVQWSWEARVKAAQRIADEQHAEYNDGTSHLVKQYLIGPKGQFDTWLNGWVDILNPKEQAA